MTPQQYLHHSLPSAGSGGLASLFLKLLPLPVASPAGLSLFLSGSCCHSLPFPLTSRVQSVGSKELLAPGNCRSPVAPYSSNLCQQFVCVCVCAHALSHVQLSVTPWTVACQAPLSTGFSRQEYRSGLPFPSPGGLPDPGIKPLSPSLALVGKFFTNAPCGKPAAGLSFA